MSDRKIDCAVCARQIDAEVKVCPYCGTNPGASPRTGEAAPVRRGPAPREELPPHETVIEYVRQRQALVVAGVIAGVFVLLFGLHKVVTYWNLTNVSPEPPKPLTEVADVAGSTQARELPIPPVELSYAGSSRRFRTPLLEPGAVAPAQPPATGSAADTSSTASFALSHPPIAGP